FSPAAASDAASVGRRLCRLLDSLTFAFSEHLDDSLVQQLAAELSSVKLSPSSVDEAEHLLAILRRYCQAAVGKSDCGSGAEQHAELLPLYLPVAEAVLTSEPAAMPQVANEAKSLLVGALLNSLRSGRPRQARIGADVLCWRLSASAADRFDASDWAGLAAALADALTRPDVTGNLHARAALCLALAHVWTRSQQTPACTANLPEDILMETVCNMLFATCSTINQIRIILDSNLISLPAPAEATESWPTESVLVLAALKPDTVTSWSSGLTSPARIQLLKRLLYFSSAPKFSRTRGFERALELILEVAVPAGKLREDLVEFLSSDGSWDYRTRDAALAYFSASCPSPDTLAGLIAAASDTATGVGPDAALFLCLRDCLVGTGIVTGSTNITKVKPETKTSSKSLNNARLQAGICTLCRSAKADAASGSLAPEAAHAAAKFAGDLLADPGNCAPPEVVRSLAQLVSAAAGGGSESDRLPLDGLPDIRAAVSAALDRLGEAGIADEGLGVSLRLALHRLDERCRLLDDGAGDSADEESGDAATSCDDAACKRILCLIDDLELSIRAHDPMDNECLGD
uniref:SpoU_methylase domain-containing protein n=1 Tax=Macrostomum lignano TaxID=282301 RepID=A0A1I8GY37_9PLAT